MLKLFPLLAILFVFSLAAEAARPGHEGGGENPCLSVSNTCGIVGFKGADIWKKCVEPLKQGKKVVSPDGTVVAPDVPDACKKAKPPGGKGGKEGQEGGKDAANGDNASPSGHAHKRGGSVSSGDSGSGSSSSGGN